MDYFLIAYGALLLALSFFFGKYGSLWIDRLYLKNLHWSTYFGHKISKIRCQKIK